MAWRSTAPGTTGNRVRGNSVHSNSGTGIENTDGGNTELTPPVITSVGSASGTACANCIIDIYSDSAEEGRVYHGSTAASGAGNWSYVGAVVGPNVTATATNASGNTSEFSAPYACVGAADVDGDAICNSGDNCPAWPNAAQDLPPWPVPASDPDCDGWNDTREAWMGTDPLMHCNATTTPNDEPDAWPTDFNDSRTTNLSDVVLMGPVYNQPTGTDPAKRRFDLNASGTVNLSDVVLMGPFYNKTCA